MDFLYIKRNLITITKTLFRNPNRLSVSSLTTLAASFLDPIQNPSWIRSKMQESAKRGDLLEALSNLNQIDATIWDYNALLHCYFKSGNISPHEVVQIFENLKKFGPKVNALTFNTLSNGFRNLGFLENSLFALQDMQNHGFVPSYDSLNRLIKKFLNSGNFDLALEVSIMMTNLNYLPILPVFNKLIFGLWKSGRINETYENFNLFENKGLFPNVYSFNPIIFGLCKNGHSYKALSFFYNLKKKGYKLNVYSYTALIYGFCNQGLFKEAYNILNQMTIDNIMPNVVTYTILIKFFCRNKKIKEAKDIFEIAYREGCLDLTLFNVLIHGLISCNKMNEAYELVNIMENKGFLPDKFTFSSWSLGLLKLWRTKSTQKTLYELFLANYNSNDIVNWNIYLNSLCTNGKSKEALIIIIEMIEKGLTPSNVTFNTIIKGFCKENKLEEAIEILDLFIQNGFKPDSTSFNTILSFACKLHEFAIARRILNLIKDNCVQLNSISFTCLIKYYCTQGRLTKGFKLFDLMVLNGIIPSIYAYNVLLNYLFKKNNFNDACIKMEELKKLGFSPDRISYNILIHNSIIKREYNLANKFYNEMINNGFKPDNITFGIISLGFCNNGDVNGALYKIRAKMINFGIKPSVSYYNVIMDALFERYRLWDVIFVLELLQNDGLVPDEISFKILNKALARGGRKFYPNAFRIIQNLMNYLVERENEIDT